LWIFETLLATQCFDDAVFKHRSILRHHATKRVPQLLFKSVSLLLARRMHIARFLSSIASIQEVLVKGCLAVGGGATEDDVATVRTLFEAVGVIELVDESLISAVTGLSGSGPAYVYLIIESLADGGVRAGLPRPIAMKLAAQTGWHCPSSSSCFICPATSHVSAEPHSQFMLCQPLQL
jgi:hypothetical protein